MATKVFISWSGDLSNTLAEAVRQWIPGVLQFVKPYFTPSDIEKGTRWGSDIMSELDSSDIGIICLTKENLNRPWVLFESGALSKNFDKSHVCTLLFDVDTTDLTGPLTLFQNTKFCKKDFKKLVQTINGAGGDSKLEESVLDDVFTMWWPRLEKQVAQILSEHKTDTPGDHRTERDILEEILELSRLAARRRGHEPSFTSDVLVDIVVRFAEIQQAIRNQEFRRAEYICSRLRDPIEFLCNRHPDIGERARMLSMTRRHGLKIEESEEES